jgi:hypothetical protein
MISLIELVRAAGRRRPTEKRARKELAIVALTARAERMRNIAARIAIPTQFTGLTPVFSERRAPNARSERRSKAAGVK